MTKPIPHDPPSPRRPAPRLILASESPRRAALLRAAGFDFDVARPVIHEPECLAGNPPPAHLAEALSYLKARSLADRHGEGVILAGDTVAARDGQVFGKPADRVDARRILCALMGTTHHVITGVTVMDAASRRRRIAHACTTITMHRMNETELTDYLDSGEWAGKAGAYGIQDHGGAFVAAMDGSFSNVVGLPLELVGSMLAEFGIFSSTSQTRDFRK